MSPRDALREAVAAEHKLHLQLRELQDEAARWRRRAALAAGQNEPELARQAVQRAASLDGRALAVRRLYDEHAVFIRSAKSELRATRRPSSGPENPDARLRLLAEEERLERDLAALKAQLA
ncbi:MAG TPA: hypothetical protein VFS62_09725 [Chloroflexota bacterium]|nr:hypothetical protein [Chloroflexota bacterium]